MGRIRTMLIKRTGANLIKTSSDNFTVDFSHNKKALGELTEMHSKKLRNVVAGYITSLVKQNQKKQH